MVSVVNKTGQIYGCYEILGLTNSPKYTYEALWLCRCTFCGREFTFDDLYLGQQKNKRKYSGCKECKPKLKTDGKGFRFRRGGIPCVKTGLPNSERGYVYIIGTKELPLFKIGVSVSPDKRLKQLQASSPATLFIWYVFDSDIESHPKWLANYKEESDLHIELANYRAHGEWFLLCKESLSILLSHMEHKKILFQAEVHC